MESNATELTPLLQGDRIAYLSTSLGREEWVLVYDSIRTEQEFGSYFCAFVPNSRLSEVQSNPSWELHIGQSMPGCSVSYTDEEQIVQYEHYTQLDSIMPLVLVRDFHDIRPDYIEILEEFRLFHNLYHDAITNTYIKIGDHGEEEDVIRIQDRTVRIKLWAIKQFLAIKEMHLAVYL